MDSEEDYYPSRKENRQERKRITERDRSKYKKSDIDQRQKQEGSDFSHLKKGRVLSITAQSIVVDCSGEIFECTLRRTLLQEKRRVRSLVTVGDIVFFEEITPGEGAISGVQERYSLLSRADALDQKKQHAIAANIDQVLVTASVVSPPLKPSLIDRYIIAARLGKMEPVIIINKVDLLDDRQLFNSVVEIYRELGLSVIPLSAETGEGLDQLKEAMADKSSVFAGQSGVGKSSLINAVTGLDLTVGEVVAKTRKGAHTTTRAELIPLEQGGWCIDTPGIKSFGMWNLSPQEVRHYYTEIAEASDHCRYPNCTHTHEPGCYVTQAVERQEISSIRYQSYRSLIEDLDSETRRR